MAATEIVVQNGGFQTTRTLTYQQSQEEMYFINDGYTVLFVKNGTVGDIVVSFTPVPDNAGRTKIVDPEDPTMEITPAWTLATTVNATFGPFRPIWFNSGAGVVQVGFDTADAAVLVAAIRFQF